METDRLIKRERQEDREIERQEGHGEVERY
jgi:hypothetical protein